MVHIARIFESRFLAWGVCTCGWTGPRRAGERKSERASVDATAHAAQAEGGK